MVLITSVDGNSSCGCSLDCVLPKSTLTPNMLHLQGITPDSSPLLLSDSSLGQSDSNVPGPSDSSISGLTRSGHAPAPGAGAAEMSTLPSDGAASAEFREGVQSKQEGKNSEGEMRHFWHSLCNVSCDLGRLLCMFGCIQQVAFVKDTSSCNHHALLSVAT